jgi:hypothetical protein
MDKVEKIIMDFYDNHPKIVKFWEKHPYWFTVITGAISGTTTSLCFNIILLLAKKLLK